MIIYVRVMWNPEEAPCATLSQEPLQSRHLPESSHSGCCPSRPPPHNPLPWAPFFCFLTSPGLGRRTSQSKGSSCGPTKTVLHPFLLNSKSSSKQHTVPMEPNVSPYQRAGRSHHLTFDGSCCSVIHCAWFLIPAALIIKTLTKWIKF